MADTSFNSGIDRLRHFCGYLAMALIGLLSLQNVRAQGVGFWNPADLSMPWTSSVNPAVISYQETKFSVGLKVPHVGFVPDDPFDLRENHVNVNLPFFLPGRIGLGVDMRYYKAGINTEIATALLLSREVVRGFSVGLKLGIENRAFDKNGFNIVDGNDPVLTGSLSANSPNLGLGLFWRSGNFSFGVGLDHLNRANIGLGSKALLPREMAAAVGYRIGSITPTFVVHDDGLRTRMGFFFAFAPSRSANFRIGHETSMPLKLEATIQLRNNHSLGYTIDLPTENTRDVSSGSHEFVYSKVISSEIGTPELILPIGKLEVVQEKVTRGMPADIGLADLASNPDLIQQFLSPVGLRHNLMVIPAGALGPNETVEGRVERFREYAGAIVEQLNGTSDLEVIVRADDKTMPEAALLRKYLQQGSLIDSSRIHVVKLASPGWPNLWGFEPGRVTVRRKRPTLSSPGLQIQVQVPGKSRRVKRWGLRILDASQNVVREYSGKEMLPATLSWNWRNPNDQLVPPGFYTLDLRVQCQSGKIKAAKPARVEVTYIKRSVNLHFKEDREMETTFNRQTKTLNQNLRTVSKEIDSPAQD